MSQVTCKSAQTYQISHSSIRHIFIIKLLKFYHSRIIPFERKRICISDFYADRLHAGKYANGLKNTNRSEMFVEKPRVAKQSAGCNLSAITEFFVKIIFALVKR